MKIGILTMHRVPNFGSLLQAYSLKKILTNFGHEVKFIDILENSEDNALMTKTINFSYETKKSEKKNLLSKLSKIDRYALNRIRIKKLSIVQEKEFNKFLLDKLKIYDIDEKVDLCIIGSDEVFNCATSSKWGFTSQLFGNVKNADKVATYAASCGSTTIDVVPLEARKLISKYLDKLIGLSVRDDNTYSFAKALTSNEVKMHLDPVVIGDFDDEIANVNIGNKLPKKYCIVYSYYNRMNDKNEIKKIKKYCKENKLELVTIGAPQMWIKNHLVLDPFEVLYAFKHADFIVTDTFHGSIFSAKYAKNFLILTRNSNSNKLTSLIKHLGLEKHHAKNIDEINEISNVENDTQRILKITNEARSVSLEYLKEITK